MSRALAVIMSSRGDINVLFTSAGRRVELLRAFRDAYSRSTSPGI